jgi:hypothetical protein
MRSLWSVVLVSAVLAACPVFCSAAPYMLSDFESDADFTAWEADGHISNCPDPCTPLPATLARLSGHATEGSYSCQIDLNPADYQRLVRLQQSLLRCREPHH